MGLKNDSVYLDNLSMSFYVSN